MARAGRACKVNNGALPCGKRAVRDGLCGDHLLAREADRGSRQERGYDAQHDKIRLGLLQSLKASERRGIVSTCWRCGCAMTSGQALDADHSGVLASAGGRADCLAHRACNRARRTCEDGPCPYAH